MAIECRRGNVDRAKEVLVTWSVVFFIEASRGRYLDWGINFNDVWHVPNFKWVSSKGHPLRVATWRSLPGSRFFFFLSFFWSALKMPVNVSSQMSLNYTFLWWIIAPHGMRLHCQRRSIANCPRRAWRKLAGLQMSPATASCCKAISHLDTPTLGVIGCLLGDARAFFGPVVRW